MASRNNASEEGAASAAPSSDEKLLALDKEIDRLNGEGIESRWEFGRILLTERVGKQLPEGRLDKLVKKTSKTRAELQNRMRFAERYPTEEEVYNAVIHFGSWHNIANKGLAAKAGKPKKRRKLRAVKDDGLWQNEEVLAWVRKRMKAGRGRDEIMAESKAGSHGYPASKHLPQNAVDRCIAIIKDRERRPAQKKSPTGKRLHEIGKQRAAFRRQQELSAFWEACHDITKLVGYLESLRVEHLELDEHTLDQVNDLHDDLLRLQEWRDRIVLQIEARLGEQNLRNKIVALRNKTIENGCPPDEVESAQAAADRLEHRLSYALSA